MHKHRQQQGHGRQAARKNRDGSVPGRNANGDDILTADDRAALEIVLEDQDRAKLEPAERLERHFRAGHFILRGDTYATLKSNGHMGKVYARAAAEWDSSERDRPAPAAPAQRHTNQPAPHGQAGSRDQILVGTSRHR